MLIFRQRRREKNGKGLGSKRVRLGQQETVAANLVEASAGRQNSKDNLGTLLFDQSWDQMIPSIKLDSASAIKTARAALEENRRFLLGNEKVETEFYDQDLLTREDRYMAVEVALQEISPICRLGPQPPNDISYGKQLYAFCWESAEFNKRMYFKFALSCDAGRTHLYVYSFHESTDKVLER
jgi:hypothetical protein